MNVELTARSPVHVGSGEKLSTGEAVFADGRAYVPDVRGYFGEHPEEIDEFVAAMERGQPPRLFFDDARHARYALDPWADERSVGGSPISVATKNGRDEPYLPGSSLKGAIRTALAYRALASGDLELDSLEGWAVDRLFRLGQNDPKNDLLKCLSVRDSDPIDPDDSLALGEIKTYSRSKAGDMRPKHWSNYAELFRPGTTLETEITVDAGLLREMVETYGERRKAKAVMGEEFTERGVCSTIEDALGKFGRAVEREERRLTGEFEDVETFYDGFGKDRPHLRVGFGTGYYSNTILSVLSNTERVFVQIDNRRAKGPFHEGCGGALGRDRRHDGKLFCHKCKTGDLDPAADEVAVPFPKTRRLVHRNGSPRYPLGWLEARFD